MKVVQFSFFYPTILIFNILSGCIRANYQFQTEKIRSIEKSFRITYRGKYSEHPFAEMKSDTRGELCLQAQVTDPSPSEMPEDAIVFEAEVWVIRYFDSERKRRDIVIKCPTMPSSYLRLEHHNPHHIKIMLVQNISERYQFVTEFAESVSLVEVTSVKEYNEERAEQSGLQDVPEDDLSFWTIEDRWNVCVAARNYVESTINERMTISQAVFTDKPQIYEFVYSKKKSQRYISLKCPTTPNMYLRLDEKLDHIKVVLLKEEIFRKPVD